MKDIRDDINGDLSQQYRNGVPFAVTIFNTPSTTQADVNADLGVFVQDTWTIRRLTLNPGVRCDYFNSSMPEQTAPAGRFVPARTFDAIENVPNWKNVSPRFGAAYDLFGNGKTAIKGNFGMYVQSQGTGLRHDLQPDDVLDRHAHLERPERRRHRAGERARADEQSDLRRAAQPESRIRTSSGRIRWSTTSASSTSCGRGFAVSVSYNQRTSTTSSGPTTWRSRQSDYTLLTVADPRGNGQTLPVYSIGRSEVRAGQRARHQLEPRTRGSTTASTSSFNYAACAAAAPCIGGTSTGQR